MKKKKEKIIRIEKMLDNRYFAEYKGIGQFGKTPVEAKVSLMTLLRKIEEAKLSVKPDPIIIKHQATT